MSNLGIRVGDFVQWQWFASNGNERRLELTRREGHAIAIQQDTVDISSYNPHCRRLELRRVEAGRLEIVERSADPETKRRRLQ